MGSCPRRTAGQRRPPPRLPSTQRAPSWLVRPAERVLVADAPRPERKRATAGRRRPEALLQALPVDGDLFPALALDDVPHVGIEELVEDGEELVPVLVW